MGIFDIFVIFLLVFYLKLRTNHAGHINNFLLLCDLMYFLYSLNFLFLIFRQIVPRRVSGIHGRAGCDTVDETSTMASGLFDQYCSANTFASIMSTFHQLCDCLELKPSDHQNFYYALKSRLQTWRAQSLWAKLDKRAQHREYKKGKACANTRVRELNY